jgi:hypothetical protein
MPHIYLLNLSLITFSLYFAFATLIEKVLHHNIVLPRSLSIASIIMAFLILCVEILKFYTIYTFLTVAIANSYYNDSFYEYRPVGIHLLHSL